MAASWIAKAAAKATQGPALVSMMPPAAGPITPAIALERLTGAELLAAMIDVAERTEIGVITGPIENLARRCDDAEQQQRAIDAVYQRDGGKLESRQESPEDQRAPHPNRRYGRQDQRAKRKAKGQNGGHDEEDLRRRQARLQQEHHEENTAETPCKRNQSGMEREAVDGAIGEERHLDARRSVRTAGAISFACF